jgi:signal transduction histidine kinase
VTLAQHAVAGLLTEEGSPRETLYTSGLDDAATIGLKPPSLDSAVLTCVVRERRPVRTRNPEGRPEVLGLPAGHPAVSSLLSVPIASSSRVYGWLSLQNKLGSDEFTDIDERVAVTLGVHAGLAYENTRLFDQLRQRATAVEQELVHMSGLVREEERARLSQALHDQLGQVLIGLKVDSQWLALQLPPVIGCSRRDITERVDSIVHCLDLTIRSVRTMARERRPAAPDKLGLVGAIAWQAQECERRSGIRCRMDSRIDQISLESTRETAVVRTVQEALMNVLQHAQATRATVTVGKSVKSLTVSVADNGRGISSRELANSSSLGLTGMREQAVRLGGRLNVYRRRPRGTVVRLMVPLVAAKGSRA